jgi:hypothetical protein
MQVGFTRAELTRRTADNEDDNDDDDDDDDHNNDSSDDDDEKQSRTTRLRDMETEEESNEDGEEDNNRPRNPVARSRNDKKSRLPQKRRNKIETRTERKNKSENKKRTAPRSPKQSRKRRIVEEESGHEDVDDREEEEENDAEVREDEGEDSGNEESVHIPQEVCQFLGNSRYHSRQDCILCTYRLGLHYTDPNILEYVPVGDGTMDRLINLLKDGYRNDQVEIACVSIATLWNTHVRGQNKKFIEAQQSTGEKQRSKTKKRINHDDDVNFETGDDDDDDGEEGSDIKYREREEQEYCDPEWDLELDNDTKAVQYRPLPEINPKLAYDHFIFHTTPHGIDVVKDLRNTNLEIHRIRSKINKVPSIKQLGQYVALVKTLDTMCKLKMGLRREMFETENGTVQK